jgi:polysaccharide pyruvyl transferase WcaK-like protein
LSLPAFKTEEAAAQTTVTLLGVTYNTGNYGVRALLSGTVESIVQTYENVQINILDYGVEPDIWNEQTSRGDKSIPLINLRFTWKLYLPNNIFRLLCITVIARLLPSNALKRRLLYSNPWLRQILSACVHFSLSGGDSFSDIYGLRRLLYVSLPQILVLLLDKPLVLLPQTYGPFKNWFARCIARWILKRATLIYSRDVRGLALVRKLFPNGEVEAHFAPDLGFAMRPESVREEIIHKLRSIRNHNPLVGLNISRLLYMGGYNRNNMFGLKEDYPSLVRGLLDFLVNKLKVTVLLIPHVFGGPESEESELMLYRSLWQDFQKNYGNRILFFNETFTHRQMKTIIGQCTLFIGSRMHACIAAISQNVPSIALAYSNKFTGVMNSVCDAVRVVDLRQAQTYEVCKTVNDTLINCQQIRDQLERRMPEINAQIYELFRSEAVQKMLSCDVLAENAS